MIRKLLRRRRRRRIALLALLLALLVAILFIPVPAGLLKGKIRGIVQKELGLDVSFNGVWFTVATGTLDLDAVVLRDPRSPQTTFSVGRLAISGPIEGLLLKNKPWPTAIQVEDTAPIRARLGKGGPELTGPLADIVERIVAARRNRPATAAPAPSSTGTSGASQLPTVRILNTVFVLDAKTTDTALLSLTLQEALFLPAPEGSKDFRFEFVGVLGTATPASTTGRLRYNSADRLWEAEWLTDNLDGSFPLDGALERVWWRVKNLRSTARITASSGEGVSIGLGAASADVELASGSIGTRPLFRGPLGLQVNAFHGDDSTTWTLHSARLTGPDVDLTLGGQIDARTPHRFKVDLGVAQVPGRIYQLAQHELAEQQATFDFPTSAGLRLNVHVEGRPDQITSATLAGQITLEAIRLRHPLFAQALSLQQIHGRITNRGAELDIARWRLGEIGGSASARLDGLPLFGHSAGLSAQFRLGGDAEELVRIGRSLQLLPPQVERFDGVIRGEANLATTLAFDRGRLVALRPDWSTQVSWVDGLLVLTEWQDPIRMETGALRISPASLDIVRLRTTGGGVDIRWNGSVRGDPVFWNDPRLTVEADGEATVPALVRLMDFEGVGLTRLQDVDGKLRVNLAWNGPLARLDQGRWTADLRARDIAFPLPLRGDTANVHRLNFDARLTSQTFAVNDIRAMIDDIEFEGKIVADDKAIRAEAKVRGAVETALRLFREDLAEFRGGGVVPAEASAGLEARDPLPSPDLPLLARWIQLLTRPGAIGVKGDPPVRPYLRATLYPDGASFWHEEMPHSITNIRGRVTADLTGLQFHRVLSQWADVNDTVFTGKVVLGSFPVLLYFDAYAPRFDVMNWVDGWGNPPDGRHGRNIYRDAAANPTPRLMTIIQGTLHAKEVTINRLKGRNGAANLRYENWRNRENTLDIQNILVSGYDGTASGSIQMTMERRGVSPKFNIVGHFANLETQPFLTDLFGREEQTVGRFHGYLRLGGQFADLSTFVGEGSLLLRNTRILGGPIFPLLGKILKAPVVKDLTFSDIRGAYRIQSEKIIFERLFLDSPGVRLFAVGAVGFLGQLDMDISVGFYSQTLNKIPGFTTMTSWLHQFGSSFLKFRATGTLTEPELSAVPFSADMVERALGGNPDQPNDSSPPPEPTPTSRPPFQM